MKEVPETKNDVKNILLNQMELIKQESSNYPENLPELTDALCKVVAALQDIGFLRRD